MLEPVPIDSFFNHAYRDKTWHVKISRNTLIALVLSLFMHAVLFFAFVPEVSINPLPVSKPLEINLAPLPKNTSPEPAQVFEPIVENIEVPAPTPKVITKKITKAKPKPTQQDFKIPEVLATPEPTPQVLPQPSPKPAPTDNAPVDMMALVNRNRSRREAADAEAAKMNAEAAAAERGPSEDERRNQRIMQNLKVGTNGIFEIRRIDALGGSFSFKGWTDNASNARMQYFEVDAKPGEDTRLAIIRRMISLIREHYQGDFTWESHRLGRSVTLSARIEDTAGLEDFLMTEFFGKNYK